MTISYSGNFFKLLARWKGSLWKAVWWELLTYLSLYGTISIIYRFVLNGAQRETFERISMTFNEFTKLIPVTFLLGFYVTAVVKRWWEQFNLVAWPDDVLTYICMIIPGREPKALMQRRTIARWLTLTTALAWRDVSITVRKRFPTTRHLILSGLMTDQEHQCFTETAASTTRWQLPLLWIQRLVERELINGTSKNTASPPVIASFLRELNDFRACCRKLYCYDWVCIPLVYTQVAALATYGYFVLCLLGHQYLDPKKQYTAYQIDMYFPVLTVLQFAFYVGWFKVGQYLMRPFEEDDDDLELNYFIDRHLSAALSIVDEAHATAPSEGEDSFRAQTVPVIPYTRAAAKDHIHPPKLHAYVRLKSDKDAEVVEKKAMNPRKSLMVRQF